ncbi:hypothetical protein CDAR_609081 [Caerostris darwini]|uniref:Secreted protein n=1 Tax=Caerostris darwini TaxID=1538125 RepID=A0AAV4WMR7_9ARAC|nr:hypothetical protein CDAR_609081 [Caerostris darwini]
MLLNRTQVLNWGLLCNCSSATSLIHSWHASPPCAYQLSPRIITTPIVNKLPQLNGTSLMRYEYSKNSWVVVGGHDRLGAGHLMKNLLWSSCRVALVL